MGLGIFLGIKVPVSRCPKAKRPRVNCLETGIVRLASQYRRQGLVARERQCLGHNTMALVTGRDNETDRRDMLR